MASGDVIALKENATGSFDQIKLTPSDIGASATSHTHDDRYYTETEIDTKIGNIETLLAAL